MSALRNELAEIKRCIEAESYQAALDGVVNLDVLEDDITTQVKQGCSTLLM